MAKLKTKKEFDLMELDAILGNEGLSADKYPDDEGYRWIATADESTVSQEELEAAINNLEA